MTTFPTATLKKEIDGHEVRIQSLEKGAVVRDQKLITIDKDIGMNRRDIDALEDRHEALENIVIESGATLKLVRWLLVGFGGSIIALIWSLITGQASVIFH